MTEQEWLASDKADQMLEALSSPGDPVTDLMDRPISDRKLRLLACAWARRVWPRLPASTRIVVDGVEQWADNSPPEWLEVPGGRRHGCQVARWLIHRPVHEGVIGVMMETRDPERRQDASQPEQAAILREIVGNSFRPVLRLSDQYQGDDFRRRHAGALSEYLVIRDSWLTPQVLTLAQATYEDRDWERLLAVADALEEAGCDSRDMLRHLRGLCPVADDAGRHRGMVDPTDCPHCSGEIETGQMHVLGCWALDLILGKE